MSKLMICFSIALLSVTVIQTRSRRIKLEIYNINCNIITAHMKRFDCYFRKKSEGHFIVNQYLMFAQNLGKDFQVRVWLQMQLTNTDKSVNFIDVKLNVCEMLTNPIEGRLLMTLISDIKRSSNIKLVCPIKGNILYKMLNYSINDAYVPSYAPLLNFSYICEFYDKKKLFGVSQVIGAIVPRKL